jgi:uncharacterized membrane protein YdbT with pleckstrin-like domain
MNDPVPVKSQAEAMLERVSPEGRARALKAQRKAQQARMRIVGRCLLASLLVVLSLAAVNALLTPVTPAILAGAILVMALAWAGIGYAARPRPVNAAEVSRTTSSAVRPSGRR